MDPTQEVRVELKKKVVTKNGEHVHMKRRWKMVMITMTTGEVAHKKIDATTRRIVTRTMRSRIDRANGARKKSGEEAGVTRRRVIDQARRQNGRRVVGVNTVVGSAVGALRQSIGASIIGVERVGLGASRPRGTKPARTRNIGAAASHPVTVSRGPLVNTKGRNEAGVENARQVKGERNELRVVEVRVPRMVRGIVNESRAHDQGGCPIELLFVANSYIAVFSVQI